jgi:hypothetical protein
MTAWLVENFGLPGNNFRVSFEIGYMDIEFNDEKDAIFFMLRWS